MLTIISAKLPADLIAPTCQPRSRGALQRRGWPWSLIIPCIHELIPYLSHSLSPFYLDGVDDMSSVFSPTTALSPTTEANYANALPQYGFGPQVTFDGLVAGNPFLFRVYTPHGNPPQYESSDPYFVGAKYNDTFSSATFRSRAPEPSSSSSSAACTYADVIQHLDWTKRSESPYISTSFSFAWAIWEAIRRYHSGVKHDVEIAVIDARAIRDHAVTAVELLMKANPKE